MNTPARVVLPTFRKVRAVPDASALVCVAATGFAFLISSIGLVVMRWDQVAAAVSGPLPV
jgi:hypothetical protein